MTVSIAHLSDPHITIGALAHEPASGLRRALARAHALQPVPDCIVLTGDLVDGGRPGEYAALREILGSFDVPVHLVAGNHDSVAALLDEFGGTAFLGGGDSATYAIDYPEFTLVVLNSKVSGEPGGRLDAEQLEWLDGRLDGRRDVPAVVCLHHPPLPVGMPYLDGMRLEDESGLAAVLARHPHVVRVLCGHVHRPIVGDLAGTTVAVAPSTYLQADLKLGEGAPGYVPEPTGFLLHLGTGASWVTHVVAVSHAAAPIAWP